MTGWSLGEAGRLMRLKVEPKRADDNLAGLAAQAYCDSMA